VQTTFANQTLETNCRPASPLVAWLQFEHAVHAQPCVSGGSRSALTLVKNDLLDPTNLTNLIL